MKCRICGRVLFYDATDGLQIGPVCAKARGLLPPRERRISLFSRARRGHAQEEDTRQLDWITILNTGPAGESRPCPSA